MSENFTKEPWEISDMSGVDAMDKFTVCFHIGVSRTGEIIADCQSDNKADYERVKANAHLMKAAPEMYRVLSGICGEKSARCCNYASESCNVCSIRKVLKKARGGRMTDLKKYPFCESKDKEIERLKAEITRYRRALHNLKEDCQKRLHGKNSSLEKLFLHEAITHIDAELDNAPDTGKLEKK